MIKRLLAQLMLQKSIMTLSFVTRRTDYEETKIWVCILLISEAGNTRLGLDDTHDELDWAW